jgi:hypothetical protein
VTVTYAHAVYCTGAVYSTYYNPSTFSYISSLKATRFSTLGYFHQTTSPIGPWFTGWSGFAYGVVFAMKIDSKIAKIWSRGVIWHRGIRLFCQSSPLTLTFSSMYCMWCLPIYFFLLWFPFKGNASQSDPIPRSHWHRWIRIRGLIEATESFSKISKSDPAVSLKPRDPIPPSHWDYGIRTLQTIISIFPANRNAYVKRLQPVNKGPRKDCLILKNWGSKISWNCYTTV